MDKRRDSRLLKKLRVSYTVLAKADSTPYEFGESLMIDVSRAGLAMVTEEPIPVPMLIQVQLRVPHRATSVFVLGKSVYCVLMEELGMYRVGVKFVGLLPADLETIIEEIRALKELAPPPILSPAEKSASPPRK